MLDNRKIRIMTKLAGFEKTGGREDIKLDRFYKNDYVRLQGIKTILGVTVAYLVILGMLFAYHLEYFIENVVKINYKELSFILLMGYLGLVALYIIISHIKSTYEYEKSRRRLKKYYQNLKDLQTLYKDEAAEVRENRE